MRIEAPYTFRKDLNEIHRPNRRHHDLIKNENEIEIDSMWSILIPENSGRVIDCAADDLQNYFHVSMNLDLPLVTKDPGGKSIVLKCEALPDAGKRSYRLDISEERIVITGTDPEGVGQGCYYLEDLMNLREAPYLEKISMFREPLFTPRMIHSGWGLDLFPDAYLSKAAHEGFDSILLFVTAPGKTTHGFMDFNDLIDRCEKYGLGVYFYSYLDSFKSPDDPDADEFFENNFGAVFRASPKAKGLILVGESCHFPSKDERCTGRMRVSSKGRVVTTDAGFKADVDYRPSPGFFPCRDYPQWVNAVKRAVRRYTPDADIVFWTYNWGGAPEKERLELIDSLPDDVSLLATFEMYKIIRKYANHQTVQPDYSITFPGPGEYFSSEAKAAKKRNLKLYTQSNTAGRTWDFGVIPYVPVPQQWLKRFKAMIEAHDNWGLSGVMDGHHYGWYPSEISEYAKWCFWSPMPDPADILKKMAVRDFGAEAAEKIVEGWALWSRAIDSYTPGFDDQAGPLRVGPSYPFIFQPVIYPFAEYGLNYPVSPQSPVGARWLHTNYYPEQVANMTFNGRRVPEDIRIMSDALAIWEQGNACMIEALKQVPENKKERAEKAIGVGIYCSHALRTMINTKKWWLTNRRLEIEYDFDRAHELVDELEQIIADEESNVKATIPLVEADSRLGWEPSMDYIGGAWHLNWKLYQLSVLHDHTLPAYRKGLCRNPIF